MDRLLRSIPSFDDPCDEVEYEYTLKTEMKKNEEMGEITDKGRRIMVMRKGEKGGRDCDRTETTWYYISIHVKVTTGDPPIDCSYDREKEERGEEQVRNLEEGISIVIMGLTENELE
eukprot:PDM72105.1 hypothetical protein PRIPAC_38539 [Pristionchus pacificus]